MRVGESVPFSRFSQRMSFGIMPGPLHCQSGHTPNTMPGRAFTGYVRKGKPLQQEALVAVCLLQLLHSGNCQKVFDLFVVATHLSMV